MSFFGDLKAITKASAKAVSDGVELFADLAEEVSQSSEKMLISSRLDRAEKEFVRNSLNNASESEIKRYWDEFNEHFDELIPRSSEEERQALVCRRQKLEARLDQSSMKRLKNEIDTLTNSMKNQKFGRPVDEIQALNRKKLMCLRLVELCKKNREEQLKASALAAIREIEEQVAELETQRDQVVLDTRDDESVKQRSHKRDGELNGRTEAFYPDGSRRFSADFVNGQFEGNAEYWREDGSLVFKINRGASGRSKHLLYLPAGQKIAECDLSGPNGTASVWFWDGYFIAKAKIVGGRANKALFLLKTVLKPGVWARLWRAKSNGSDGAHLQNMEATIVTWDAFLSELKELLRQ